ncbi:DUF2533 family protein [Anaerobacillus sp. MEB173]|uniref:DUF2533 family protein n=1 Tax=Anaerobacillus sp. MEB173 TaxID=3383345 RepID=UPI003F8EABF3
MSVHLQIQEQINKRLESEKEYQRLDDLREAAIEKALNEARSSDDFSIVAINQITEEMNSLSKKYGFPLRKTVTKAMVKEYLAKVE